MTTERDVIEALLALHGYVEIEPGVWEFDEQILEGMRNN